MTTTITVCRPDAEEAPERPAQRAERTAPPGPDGYRVALIDNGKPQARLLLESLAEELRARIDVGSVEVVSKAGAGEPIDDALAAEIAQRADVAIAALGDCGACSACSLRDAIAFERLDVPATVVITDAFVGHVGHFADTLGMPGYPTLVVPHPVSSKDAEHVRRLAEGLADAAVAQVTPG
ncbi:MAG TPA: UGSC family (seleno)protein [Baekduia sp.]|uniref:UGSC family (seleno)protein n=1 Tax=Baekduia sp. TaxID=2600305 RepID=UPI002D76918C|nr:UGSC family (seleno)protein [Baekduia sp.]HET6506989.1 UGSC family (seleno)protein [Baekduia sp.]